MYPNEALPQQEHTWHTSTKGTFLLPAKMIDWRGLGVVLGVALALPMIINHFGVTLDASNGMDAWLLAMTPEQQTGVIAACAVFWSGFAALVIMMRQDRKTAAEETPPAAAKKRKSKKA